MIPYGKQWIDTSDINCVADVLKSDFLTQGPKVPAFEKALAEYVGVNAAVMTNSATSALHVACLALGVGQGDWVWTSPMSFVASANCALYCGAQVDFVDIDEDTGNMSSEALREKLIVAKQQGCLPKVVIPVHFAGASCDMKAIYALSEEFGFKIIEDASHALGGEYQQKKVGSCLYSDITIFSFHPVKMITTGEGGCLCMNDEKLETASRLFVSHGITKNQVEFKTSQADPWWYEQQFLGFNYRMTELQAALGLSQLKKLNTWVDRRNQFIERYQSLLQGLPVQLLKVAEQTLCSYHLAVIKVASEHRRPLFDWLRSNDIGCQVHYIPIYKQPYYHDEANKNVDSGNWPHTERFYEQIISIPLFSKMTNAEQDTVVARLQEYFQ